MNELAKIIDHLDARAKRDGAFLRVYGGPLAHKVTLILEKDGCSVRNNISEYEILSSPISPYDMMDHKYDRWFEELQNKVNMTRFRDDKGE